MLDQYPVLDGSIMINLILFNPQISCSTPRLRQENRRAQLSDQRNEFLKWSEMWRVVLTCSVWFGKEREGYLPFQIFVIQLFNSFSLLPFWSQDQ